MENEKLQQMQEQSRLKHSFADILKAPPTPEETLNEILFFDGTYIPAVKALFTPTGKLRSTHMVKEPPPELLQKEKQKRPRVIQRFSPPVTPDERKEIVRQKGVYTNIPSPYGIASELLNQQLKTG